MIADVAVLGLGAIGAPIAHAFLAGGLRTAVWNRSPNRAATLVAAGAITTERAAAAIAAAPLAVVCVSDHHAARALLAGAGAGVADRTLAVLATGTPQQARDLAGWAHGHGARYLDGAILAVPHTIGRPEAMLLYSGSPTGYSDAEQALSMLGTAQFLGDDPGRAALIDTGVLTAMYTLYTGFFQASALAATADVPTARLTAVLVPWLRAVLELLPDFAAEIDRGQHPNEVSSVATNAAAVATIRAVTADQGLTNDVLAPLHSALARLLAEGRGTDGFSGLITAFRAPDDARPRNSSGDEK